MLNRRGFLKGLIGAAIVLKLPSDTFTRTVEIANAEDIDVMYVTPREWELYEKALDPRQKYQLTRLAEQGISNLMYKGIPVVATTGRIDKSVTIKGIPYRKFRERFDVLCGIG